MSSSYVKKSLLPLPPKSDTLPVSIEEEERGKSWVILIDESPWRYAHPYLFGKNWQPPQTQNLDEWRQEFHEQEVERAFVFALKRLAKSAMTEQQVEQQLRQYLISLEACQEVLDQLREAGYVNDADRAEVLTRGQKRRGYGPARIKQHLRAKGIDADLIQTQLQDEEAQQQQICDLLASRYKKRDLTDRKEKQKVIASLVRRGFSLSYIYKAIDDGQDE